MAISHDKIQRFPAAQLHDGLNIHTLHGQVTCKGVSQQTAEVFDQATKDTYSILLQSTDQGGLTVEQLLTITITEVNLAPTAMALSNTTVDENVAAGTVVGTFSTTDINATILTAFNARKEPTWNRSTSGPTMSCFHSSFSGR